MTDSNDNLVNQLAMQVAQLSAQVAAFSSRIDEIDEDSLYLHIQRGGTGGGGGYGGAWSIVGNEVVNCFFQVGRDVFSIGTQELDGDGMYCLKIPNDNPATATFGKDSASNDLDYTYIPLFEIENDVVTMDCRGMPVVPLRE